MIELLHEIWVEHGEDGQALESCYLAGPDGDDFRRLLEPGARLVHLFWAGNHYEAMTTYHQFLGREEYTTEHAGDYEPYPSDWRERQKSLFTKEC